MAMRDDLDELDDALYDLATKTEWKAKRRSPVAMAQTNPLTGGIELLVGTNVVISSGTAAPNDADGKPDGSIYFQI